MSSRHCDGRRIYLFNRHWAEARAHLLDIVDRFPESPNRAEALYQTGFTFFREYNHDEAIKWFARAHSEFPEKKDGEQGYYYVGSSLAASPPIRRSRAPLRGFHHRLS